MFLKLFTLFIGIGLAGATPVPPPETFTFTSDAANSNLRIPQNSNESQGPTVSIIAVDMDFVVCDVDIEVDITHTWTADLDIDITLDAGGGMDTTVALTHDDCGRSDDLHVVFDDSSNNIIDGTDQLSDVCHLVDGSDVKPEEPLSTFNGQNSMGHWILQINDDAGGDTGILTSWAVILTPCVDSMMGGDPHIMSWSGEWFDYHGECDLKLMHVPNFQGKDDLDIHVRTTGRYLYSYIETAAVRLGNDTLEVSSWGEYSFNGVDGAKIKSQEAEALRKSNVISSIGRYPIFHTPTGDKTHRFDIKISEYSNITMSILKDMVSVKVHHANKRDFGNVVGLLGDFHGHMLARDGVTDLSGDTNAMGQEWQVRDDEPMLFQAVRAPQYPAKCLLPNMAKKEARRLGEGITEEAAKVACAHLKEDPGAFRNCVYDVTATNDLDMAGSGAFTTI